MGKRCFVPECKSGYKSNSDKVSLFSPPRDNTILNIWKKNIPRGDRVLSLTDSVCAKHFEENCIITEWQNDAVTIPLKVPRLKKDAVPTIFPGCPSYLTKKPIKHRRVIDKTNSITAKRRKIILKQGGVLENTVSSADVHVQPINQQSTNSTIVNLFDVLWQNPIIKVPDETWSAHKIKGYLSRHFSISQMFISKNNGYPNLERQIAIDEGFNITLLVYGEKVQITEIPSAIVNSTNILSEIQDIINIFHNSKICAGGPNLSLYDTSKTHSECAKSDHQNQVWRHRCCPKILEVMSKNSSCTYCTSLKNTMRINNSRKNKGLRVRSTKLTTPTLAKIIELRSMRDKKRKRLVRLEEINESLHKKITHLKQNLKKVDDQNLFNQLENYNIPDSQKMVIKECIKIAKYSSKTSRRYTEDWLIFCLLLHIRSPAAYKLLNNNDILPLPSVSTIRRYLAMVNMSCGLDEKFLNAFKLKLPEKDIHQRHGFLVFDEMQVRKSIKVNVRTMKLHGIVDFGQDYDMNASAKEIADHALVFMFCPLADSYSQPIAVYATKGAAKGTILACLIIKVIHKLESAGAKIDGLVCDGASTNRRMWKEFGVSGICGKLVNKCVHPVNDDRLLYFFSDAPHLFKCIRNRIFDKGCIRVPEGLVKWKHYESVYKLDEKVPGNLKVCPKISYNHIYPSPLLKMRVKLATQIFSNSMVEGMMFYKIRNAEGLQDAEVTILITKKFNDLFDILNRKIPSQGIKLGSRDIEILKNSLKWLDSWEKQLNDGNIRSNEFLSSSTAEGLRVTLMSTIELSTYLLSTCNFKYILTAKFNQDRLEQFFGTIRQAGSCNDHPSFPTFLQLYRMLSIYKLIKPPVYGNCTVEEQQKEKFRFKDFKTIFEEKGPSFSFKHIENLKLKLNGLISGDDCDDFEEMIEREETCNEICVSNSILYYIAGFVCRKLSKSTYCPECKRALTVDSTFINYAVADLTNQKTRGFLTHPAIDMFILFQKTEKIFLNYVDSSTMYEDTITDVTASVSLSFPCELHKTDIISHALHYFVSMRMRQYFKSEDLKVKSQTREKRKLARLQTK